MSTLLVQLGIQLPIIQAPMAGTSTVELAATVSNAGALGSISVGAVNVADAAKHINAARQRTTRSLNVNVFCHAPAQRDAARERKFIQKLTPELARFGATPPTELHEIYQTFVGNEPLLALLIEKRPSIVSFHFGLPEAAFIQRLRQAGIVLLASATSLAEARQAVEAGVHAIVGQGYEAGGHRGVFDPNAHDDRMGTFALTRVLARELPVPVIAAGGIMDGAGIAAAMRLGASAAQLGTAFIGCPESNADSGYRTALRSEAAQHTVMTQVVSGRPARCLPNRITALGETMAVEEIPSYPVAYDLGKALNAAAKAKGETGYGAQWAGQGAALARSLPAAELVSVLAREIRE